LVEVFQPQALSAARLDILLSGGWFRSSSSISRLQYLCMNGAVGSIVNIRAKLEDYHFSKNFRKILSQNKKRFKHIIRQITPIDHPKERLYQQQKDKFDIFIMDSLQTFLYDYTNPTFSIFNTYEVCVYDKDELVAVSFFDLGIQSVASIIGLYDDDYHQYSLGTFTMLLEIEFAVAKGFSYFYPGYILLSERGIAFEYKLRLENLQFRDRQGSWRAIHELYQEHWIHQHFQEKRALLAKHLDSFRIDYQYFLYPYFAIAKFIDYYQCVEMPVFFCVGGYDDTEGLSEQKLLVVEHLIEKHLYRMGYVSVLNDVLVAIMTENIALSQEITNSNTYLTTPLKYESILLESNNLDEIIAMIKTL
jgi:leucyl-tRNA---protein transferase